MTDKTDRNQRIQALQRTEDGRTAREQLVSQLTLRTKMHPEAGWRLILPADSDDLQAAMLAAYANRSKESVYKFEPTTSLAELRARQAQFVAASKSSAEWLIHLNEAESIGVISGNQAFLELAFADLLSFDKNGILVLQGDFSVGFLVDISLDGAQPTYELETWPTK